MQNALDLTLATAQHIYPFTMLSLWLTLLFGVILLGIAIAALRGFIARRRARLTQEEAQWSALAGTLVQHAPNIPPAPPLPALNHPPRHVVVEDLPDGV